jgi:peroxiredoxin
MNMKRIVLIATIALIASTGCAQQTPAPIGTRLPSLLLATLAGEKTDLSHYTGKQGMVVIFVSVQCPVSNAYNERMQEFSRGAAARGFTVVGINSNRSEPADAVAQHAKEHGLTFPILKDQDNHLADALGASFTPETYVFDREGILRYHGRIDDSRDATKISQRDLQAAVDALASGKSVPVSDTKAFGCTIKRVPRADSNKSGG